MGTRRPRLRMGIIGAGMIGRAHAHAFRALGEFFQPAPAEVELAVVADADPALARDARERFGFERTATSWAEVAEARDVDLAVVVLPNHLHREAVEALVSAGKHVLCEKPLAPTAADAGAMLEAARRAGVVHAIGFNLRRAPALAAIRRAVARGDLGELRHFSGRYLTDYAASPDVPFTWRYRRALAGAGALADIGSHLIDLSRFLVGEIERVEGATLETFIARRPVPLGHVIGHARAQTGGEVREVDTDDVVSFTARFRDGAVGDFRCSRVAVGYRNSPAFELIGARGSAAFDMERPAEFQFFDGARDDDLNGFRRVVTGPVHPYYEHLTTLPVAGAGYGYTETYVAQAYELVTAVVSGSPSDIPNFADGYAAALVCDAVLRSAEQGRRVRIDEIRTGA